MSRKKENQVGYGSPPEKNQFKKGVSGNPSGRPKGKKKYSSHADLLFNLLLDEEITLPSGQKMCRMEVVNRKLANTAMSGDLAAINLLYKVIHSYLPFKLGTPRPSTEKEDDDNEDDLPLGRITRINVQRVDARHPQIIAEEMARKAGGKFVPDPGTPVLDKSYYRQAPSKDV